MDFVCFLYYHATGAITSTLPSIHRNVVENIYYLHIQLQ